MMDNSDWTYIPEPSDDENEKTESDVIEKYYWRKEGENGSELLVVFRENQKKPRYKYYDVPKSVFQEMVSRTNNPNKYSVPLEKWFLRNIAEKYDFERYRGSN